jgi:hypothetical protein
VELRALLADEAAERSGDRCVVGHAATVARTSPMATM